MPLFKDEQMGTVCPKHSPGHHIEIHMLLIDRLEGYLKIQMWETWWAASRQKQRFEWKPSNVKRIQKLVKRSCTIFRNPAGMELPVMYHLLLNANELTAMVYCCE